MKAAQSGCNRFMVGLAGFALGGTLVTVSAPAFADANGEEVFKKVCTICHGAGIGGAPKFGDTAAWVPRIAKGIATLESHALNGFRDKGVMPPRGGRSSLTDAEVKAAVAYMVTNAQKQ